MNSPPASQIWKTSTKMSRTWCFSVSEKPSRTSFLRDLFEKVRTNYFVLPVISLPKVWGDKRSGLTCTGRPEAALKILKDASFSLEGRVFFLVRLGDSQLTLAVSCFQLTGGTCTVFRLWAWDELAPAMCCGFKSHQEWVDVKVQDIPPTDSMPILWRFIYLQATGYGGCKWARHDRLALLFIV